MVGGQNRENISTCWHIGSESSKLAAISEQKVVAEHHEGTVAHNSPLHLPIIQNDFKRP